MGLNVAPLYFWSQKVLPFVYDDSLSYLEQVVKVSERLSARPVQLSTKQKNTSIIRTTQQTQALMK